MGDDRAVTPANAPDAAVLQDFTAALLERAISFALGVAQDVTAECMARPTPCRGWTLRMLFLHLNDSLDALCEGIDRGSVPLMPDWRPEDPGGDVVADFRERAARLLGAWAHDSRSDRLVTVGGCPMQAGAMASTGAMEVAVHGWDIARACGRRTPIPAALAEQLIRISPMLVADDVRHGLFDQPVQVSPDVPASDRLVALLGRDPAWVSP